MIRDVPSILRPSPADHGASWLQSWMIGLGLLLFLLMLVVPGAYKPAKGAVLALLLTTVAVDALRRRSIAVHPSIAQWCVASASIGVFFLLHGVLGGSVGASRLLTVELLWPLVMVFLVPIWATDKAQRALHLLLCLSTLLIGLHTLSYVLYSLGWLPGWLYLPLDQGQQFSAGVMISFYLHNVTSLFFLIPYLIGLLLIWPEGRRFPVPRALAWVTAGLGFIVVVLSGRMGLLCVCALSPLVALAVRALLRGKAPVLSRRALLWTVLAGLLCIAVGLVVLETATEFRVSVLFRHLMANLQEHSGDDGAAIRADQFRRLIAGWKVAPILGAGSGMPLPGYLRSLDLPWAYELSYAALLYHTGVVGVLLRLLLAGWVGVWCLRILRSGFQTALWLAPILVGTICFLIGNATNPYLGKFDSLGVILLPLAMVNLHRLRFEARGEEGKPPEESRT